MNVTQEQIDARHVQLTGEVCLMLYEKYAPGADPVVFASMPSVLRSLAEAFEEAMEV